MKTNNILQVKYQDRIVGILAKTNTGKVAFEYADSWLENGFAISPFSLPLEKKVFIPEKPYFEGLFGVFADSLPDAWGNILLNRVLRQNNININYMDTIQRLAFIGTSGMGALTYEPSKEFKTDYSTYDFDRLAKECKKILKSEYSEDLDLLYKIGGTSGGARPKIMPKINNKNWIIKFPAHVDNINTGEMEYKYSLCAKRCGIPMTETKLFPSKECKGYFGTVRFDRNIQNGEEKRLHMLTAAAILETDFEQPCLDYHDLMKLTKILTANNNEDIENMFRQACFNVFAHNRDDHAKNFTYIYNEKKNTWQLSPAYDLTYSTTYYGEHTTSIDGNGKNPGEKELLSVGLTAGISTKKCKEIITMIKKNVEKDLGEFIV